MSFSSINLSTALVFAEGGGFNPLDLSGIGGTFWTWVIFLLSLIPIWIVVMGPVTRALAARDAKAQDAIVAAEKASRDAESSRVAVEAKLREAQLEATKMVEAARARAETLERTLKADAAVQAAALLERARNEIRAEQDKAVATIRKQVVDVTLSAASQVLKRKVDGSDDRRLVEELVGAAAKTSTDGRA